jgi:hypothetical protein
MIDSTDFKAASELAQLTIKLITLRQKPQTDQQQGKADCRQLITITRGSRQEVVHLLKCKNEFFAFLDERVADHIARSTPFYFLGNDD